MTHEPDPRLARTGMGALRAEEFSLADAVGGWRGLVESVAPGLVFVVVFVAAGELMPALVGSLAVAAVAVLARLVARTPVTQALSGVAGVGIGAVWAWRSGAAQDYFAWGLITNAGFALAVAVSLLARWPLVGLVAAALGLTRRGEGDGRARGAAPAGAEDAEGDIDDAAASPSEPPLLDVTWRSRPGELRRYTLATWLWLLAFGARLAVQLPLYLGGEVGWLGTARLVMGVPLWAVVLWVTWLLVRPREAPGAARPASG